MKICVTSHLYRPHHPPYQKLSHFDDTLEFDLLLVLWIKRMCFSLYLKRIKKHQTSPVDVFQYGVQILFRSSQQFYSRGTFAADQAKERLQRTNQTNVYSGSIRRRMRPGRRLAGCGIEGVAAAMNPGLNPLPESHAYVITYMDVGNRCRHTAWDAATN